MRIILALLIVFTSTTVCSARGSVYVIEAFAVGRVNDIDLPDPTRFAVEAYADTNGRMPTADGFSTVGTVATLEVYGWTPHLDLPPITITSHAAGVVTFTSDTPGQVIHISIESPRFVNWDLYPGIGTRGPGSIEVDYQHMFGGVQFPLAQHSEIRFAAFIVPEPTSIWLATGLVSLFAFFRQRS